MFAANHNSKKRKPVNRIRERHQLSGGRMAVIQRIMTAQEDPRAGFTMYIVSACPFTAPDFFVDNGTLSECMEALASVLKNDVLEADL